MKLSAIKTIFGLALCGFVTLAAAEDIVVVVNPKNSSAALTADQVEGIFLGKTTSLPGGGTAAPVDQADGPVKDAFYQKAAAKDAAQVKAVWSRLVFSGKGTPPKAVGSSADVKKFVAGNPNGIGYIEKSAADTSVKVVFTLP